MEFSVALAVLITAVAAGQTAPPTPADEPGCSHLKHALARLSPHHPTPPQPAGLDDTDVLHYHLELTVDPTAETISGSNVMTVRSLAPALASFTFRLDDALAISAVERDGVAAAWQRLDSRHVAVTLDPPVVQGGEFDLRVQYGGAPEAQGFGSIEFHTRQSGARTVWTLSETEFAYTWWPNKDDNHDKATADLWFTVPDNMVVASNGLLTGTDDLGGGVHRYRWETSYPTATYLFAFVATNFEQFGDTWIYDDVSMPASFFIFPESNNEGNRNSWLKSVDMLTVYSDLFGLYPFVDEKYGMAQFGWGGGMEHQTITFQGGFWEYITAHELAHQWWGDAVTCAFWNDIWLNEGFATYSEALWYENRSGTPDRAALLNAMANRRPSSFNGSVYVYDANDLGSVFNGDFVYRKGGWVLHMLRHVIGDEAFFDTLAAYRQAFEFDAATTADFQLVAEQTTGRELDWFFDPWVYQRGAPAYRFDWRQAVVAGRNYVELKVRQVQDPNWPIFPMPVDIVLTIAGQPVTQVVWNDAAAEHLLFETTGPISALAFDPENWILHNPPIQVAFTEGPPKVVDVTPSPASTVNGLAASALTVTFHKNVTAAPGDFSLSGAVFGDTAFTWSYDGVSQTATLIPAALLKPDVYALTVSDVVKDVAAGLALDGEVDPLAALLPSGDGLPGGDMVVHFTVGPAGDLDGNGVVDQSDLGILLSFWGTGGGGDLDGDGETGQSDLGILLANYGL